MENRNTSLFIKKEVEFCEQYLIVNADDLGICVERDQGILELFEKKAVSSASIMVNGSSFESAISKARKLSMPLGIHLNLTEGELTNTNNIESNTLVEYDEEKQKYLMHGKFKFRELLKARKIDMNDVKNEVISQFLYFIKAYQALPDHFDGHQHIHIIPEIAEVIADLASNYFGIYYTRIPNENKSILEEFVKENKRLEFYKTILGESAISSTIYLDNQIGFPQKFFGMSIMGSSCSSDNINYLLQTIKEESNQIEKPYFIEYMCHPGYPSENYWDDFNMSSERLHEKRVIESFFRNGDHKLVPYSILSTKQNSNLNILILGDLTYGTGNSISAKRLKKIFTGLNFNTFIFNVKHLNSFENPKDIDVSSLIDFIISKKINLVVGINLWRAGRFIYSLLKKTEKEFLIDLKYMIILSGTDANIFINEKEKFDIMSKVVQRSEYIISFNKEMTDKIKAKVDNFNSYLIIPQSVSLQQSNYSIRCHLKIPKYQKITLLPSSIRAVKDPLFIFSEMIMILKEKTDHTFVIMGAKFDEKLYEEMKKLTIEADLTRRIFILDAIEHSDYINILKEVDLVVNSSVSEGMSNAIMEAMLFGIPVLARENEGNKKLIKHMENGLLYSNTTDFRELYNKIYNEKELKTTISHNSIDEINEKYGINSEIENYKKILNEFSAKYYYKLFINSTDTMNLIFSGGVHPFSIENNEIFKHHILNDERFKEINLLDVGCGAGIFSILFMLNNKHLKIKHIVLCDIDEIALSNTYQNLIYYKHCFNFDKITIIKSNLLKGLPLEYNNYFDVVLANMPQTPSKEKIRSDKHGGTLGIELFCGVFSDVAKFSKTIYKLYILHISLSAPKLLEQNLNSLKLKQKILFEQKRTLNPNQLKCFWEELPKYMLELKAKGICEFEELDKQTWSYYVWSKEITPIQ